MRRTLFIVHILNVAGQTLTARLLTEINNGVNDNMMRIPCFTRRHAALYLCMQVDLGELLYPLSHPERLNPKKSAGKRTVSYTLRLIEL